MDESTLPELAHTLREEIERAGGGAATGPPPKGMNRHDWMTS
jgi:hypothetical protein